jgi:hypothetical protein
MERQIFKKRQMPASSFRSQYEKTFYETMTRRAIPSLPPGLSPLARPAARHRFLSWHMPDLLPGFAVPKIFVPKDFC